MMMRPLWGPKKQSQSKPKETAGIQNTEARNQKEQVKRRKAKGKSDEKATFTDAI